MKSVPGLLSVGGLYSYHGHKNTDKVLECIRVITDSAYSPYCARVRSRVTGWTMNVIGTNIYEDGSIDWDFSLNGIFTDYDDDGILHGRYW